MKIKKEEVIQLFLEQFNQERDHALLQAKIAHEAATHEEAKAEDQHDTRALEASYLARGQVARVQDLENVIREFKLHLDQAHIARTEIAQGTLAELVTQGRTLFSFIAHGGGGAKIEIRGSSVNVVTLDSPLGEVLLGTKAGEKVTLDSKSGERVYQVQAVQ